MAKRLYTKRTQKQPIHGLAAGLAGLVMCGWLVWSWEPDKWWKEVILLAIAGGSLTGIGSRVLQNRKLGVIISAGIIGLLFLNRLGILDVITGILLVIVLGLITLVN